MEAGNPMIVCPRCRETFRAEIRGVERFGICPRCGYVVMENEFEYA